MIIDYYRLNSAGFIEWALARAKRKKLTEYQLEAARDEEVAELQAAICQLEAIDKGTIRRLAWGEVRENKDAEREQALASIRHELGDVILCFAMSGERRGACREECSTSRSCYRRRAGFHFLRLWRHTYG